jgi:hypothetical protein
MSRGPCRGQDQQWQAAEDGCMTMYARLWWRTLFGGTLTLGCWRSGRPDQSVLLLTGIRTSCDEFEGSLSHPILSHAVHELYLVFSR